MFSEGFIADHILEILSLGLAALGIWFVVQQLRETKLASQMEAMVHLV